MYTVDMCTKVHTRHTPSAASSLSNQSQGTMAKTQHVPQLRSSRNTTNARCFGMILRYGWPLLHCYQCTQFVNDTQELGEPWVIGDLELTVATRSLHAVWRYWQLVHRRVPYWAPYVTVCCLAGRTHTRTHVGEGLDNRMRATMFFIRYSLDLYIFGSLDLYNSCLRNCIYPILTLISPHTFPNNLLERTAN